MKSIRLFMILGLFAFAFQGAMAQVGQANLSKSGAVILDSGQSLKSTYSIDASEFNFQDVHEALAYFKDINTDYVVYRPALNQGEIMVHLQLNRQPDWSLAEWNAYLAEHKVRPTETSHQTSK